MSRSINATLENALATQQGDIILRVLTWTDQADYIANPTTPDHTWETKKFFIGATSADAELVTANDYALSAFSVFIIERGVKLADVEYPVRSGLFFVKTYQEDYGKIKLHGSSYPNLKISIAAGDGTYQQVITAFCTAIGKTAVFKNSTDAWLAYQFLPTGKALSLNKAELFESLLKQKYTILVYEESPNNLVFYNQDSYPSSAFSAIAKNNGDLLAVATAGSNGGMTSENGADWTPQTLPSFYNDACYASDLGLWVAVGASICATSTDRITWTARTIPAGTYNAITSGNSLLVAVGINVCATSTDGITWTARTIGNGTWKSIARSSTLFVAIGGNALATSTDGITWTTIPDFQAGTALSAVRNEHTTTILADGRILVVGGKNNSGTIQSTTYFGTISGNTITWAAGTAMSAARARHTTSLLSDGRILITGGDNGGVKSETYFGTISGNTITWAAGTAMSAARYLHTANILSDNRILITGGYNGGSNSETYFGTISGNTITWAAGTAIPAARNSHTANILSDNRILITGGNDNISEQSTTYFGTISGNTITWAAGTAIPAALLQHAAGILADGRIIITGGFGNSTIVDTTYFGTISGNTITWMAGTTLPTVRYQHTQNILSDNRILIIAGQNNSGIINTTYFGTAALTISCNSIIWKNSLTLFVAVGDGCITSPDSITWTARSIPAGSYNGITQSDAPLLVAVGASVIATSPDGITWTARTPAALNNWQDVIWSATLTLFIAVASDGASRIMTSPNAITWTASTANADFDLSYTDGVTSYLTRDQASVHYLWRDESASLHTLYDTTLPQWNLGFLKSTATAPTTHEDAYYKIFLQKAPIRLDITDGDKIHFTPNWSIDPTKTIDAMMQVTEHLDHTKSPSWWQEIKSISLFGHTEGGALPSTIERVAAYTPLVSTSFDGNLTPAVNNLQALAQAVDDMNVQAGLLSGAANDFQVGDGATGWIAKTLAQTITILRTSLDAIFAPIAKGVTNGDAHDHIGGDGAQIEAIPNNGWISDTNTWTRTGNHTFTLSGDHTTRLAKAVKVKYNDGAADYGQIKSSTYGGGVTTVTLLTNTDYLMAAATITGTYYSPIENPAGWPDTFNFAIDYTGFSTKPTTAYAKFRATSALMQIIYIQNALGTSNATSFTLINLPAAAVTAFQLLPTTIFGADNSANITTPVRADISSTTITLSKGINGGNDWTSTATLKGIYSMNLTYLW